MKAKILSVLFLSILFAADEALASAIRRTIDAVLTETPVRQASSWSVCCNDVSLRIT